MRLHDVIREYLDYMRDSRRFSDNTIRLRRIYLTQFLEYADENLNEPFEKITNIDIEKFLVFYANKVTSRGKKISIETVNVELRSIKAMFSWVKVYTEHKTKVIPPAIREYKVPEKHPEIILFSQVEQVIDKCENEQDSLIIATLFECGLRIEEVKDMHIEDLRDTTLSVVGKGQKHRITFMSDELARSLREYWKKQGWEIGSAFRPQLHGIGSNGYDSCETIRKRIKDVFWKALGLVMHPHQLRHAFAINLLQNGCNIVSIQKMLGHSKIETTMRYLGVSDKFLERDYKVNFGGTVFMKKS